MKISFLSLKFTLGLVSILGFVESDPDPLQDYCVADTKNLDKSWGNGSKCINPDWVLASQFATSSLSKPGNTTNQFGFNVTITTINNLPGLNTLGLAMARIDLAANGLMPLHSHPRASEVTILLRGSLLVGFVDTYNRLFTEQLHVGDCFVFPKGLFHFLYNMDSASEALVVSGLSSQNPGVQMSSNAVLTSKQAMLDEVLMKGFKAIGQDVTRIRGNLGG